MLKQSEVALLPALQIPTANAEADAKPPVQAGPPQVERPGTDAGKPDHLVPPAESVPASSGAAMRKAMYDLLGESVAQSTALEESENDALIEERPKRRTKARTLPWWQLMQREQAPVREHDLKILGSETGAASLLMIVPDKALMPDGGLSDMVGMDPKDKLRRTSLAQENAGLCDSARPGKSGDELHRVAVVAHTVNHELRPPKMGRTPFPPALRPKSKAECERRCGSDDFCDPSNLLGCGGVHCGQKRDLLY